MWGYTKNESRDSFLLLEQNFKYKAIYNASTIEFLQQYIIYAKLLPSFGDAHHRVRWYKVERDSAAQVSRSQCNLHIASLREELWYRKYRTSYLRPASEYARKNRISRDWHRILHCGVARWLVFPQYNKFCNLFGNFLSGNFLERKHFFPFFVAWCQSFRIKSILKILSAF